MAAKGDEKVWFTALLCPRKSREAKEHDFTFILDEEQEVQIYKSDKPYNVLSRTMDIVATHFFGGRENELFKNVKEKFYVTHLRTDGLWFGLGDNFMSCKQAGKIIDVPGVKQQYKEGSRVKMTIFRSQGKSGKPDVGGTNVSDLGMGYKQKAIDMLKNMTEVKPFPKRPQGVSHLEWGKTMIESAASIARLYTKILAKHDIAKMTKPQGGDLFFKAIKKKVEKAAPRFMQNLLKEDEIPIIVKFADECATKIVDEYLEYKAH